MALLCDVILLLITGSGVCLEGVPILLRRAWQRTIPIPFEENSDMIDEDGRRKRRRLTTGDDKQRAFARPVARRRRVTPTRLRTCLLV